MVNAPSSAEEIGKLSFKLSSFYNKKKINYKLFGLEATTIASLLESHLFAFVKSRSTTWIAFWIINDCLVFLLRQSISLGRLPLPRLFILLLEVQPSSNFLIYSCGCTSKLRWSTCQSLSSGIVFVTHASTLRINLIATTEDELQLVDCGEGTALFNICL